MTKIIAEICERSGGVGGVSKFGLLGEVDINVETFADVLYEFMDGP